jgi:cation transport ATPase
VIAAPIPSVCAIATSAKHGVLIKGSSVVENLSAVHILALDKTGTLTKGFFSVSGVEDVHENEESDSDSPEYDPIELAAAMESKSTHPLASALVALHCGCIAEYEGTLPDVKKVDVMEGVGMQGWVAVEDDWKHVAVGNERLLKSNKGRVRLSKTQQTKVLAFERKHNNAVILYVAVDDVLERIIALSDELRSEAFVMTNRMQKLNFAGKICVIVMIPVL